MTNKPLTSLGLAIVLLSVATPALLGGEARYGDKVKFSKGTRIVFPDFVLEYIGQHRESSEKYPRGFLFYDFFASTNGGGKRVSWSGGTGDIGPVGFALNDKRFSLELKRSDKLGPLKDDELVAWKD
jgi:hypothetical protein